MRRLLLDDPNTARIAKSVELPLDEYVEQVMKYLANPGLEPVLQFLPDEELRRRGYEPPDPRQMTNYVQERVDAREISVKSKFADPTSTREKVAGAIPLQPPATAEPGEVREDLKAQLALERSSGKYKKV